MRNQVSTALTLNVGGSFDVAEQLALWSERHLRGEQVGIETSRRNGPILLFLLIAGRPRTSYHAPSHYAKIKQHYLQLLRQGFRGCCPRKSSLEMNRAVAGKVA